MKIIVDAFGGDNSPREVIKGAALALEAKPDLKIILSGGEAAIKEELSLYSYDAARIEILDAPEIIGNDEAPVDAVRKKKNSSIVAGVGALNSDPEAGAFVSAGSTGAVLTAAVLLTKRIGGVIRPALAPELPTVNGGSVLLIDCGANADCKAANLVQFAIMGSAYKKVVSGIQNPRVGLLSNGTEDKKGNELNREAFPLLKENSKINFIGNLEARDILTGEYDVVVSDGFSGNIALKASEGTAGAMFGLIKENIEKGGLRAKLGYLLLKPALKNVKRVLDYNEKGGAMLLGLTKAVVKCHGNSKANAVKAAILQAAGIAERGLTASIEKALSDND